MTLPVYNPSSGALDIRISNRNPSIPWPRLTQRAFSGWSIVKNATLEPSNGFNPCQCTTLVYRYQPYGKWARLFRILSCIVMPRVNTWICLYVGAQLLTRHVWLCMVILLVYYWLDLDVCLQYFWGTPPPLLQNYDTQCSPYTPPPYKKDVGDTSGILKDASPA